MYDSYSMYQEFFPMYCVIYGIVSIVHILMSHYQHGKMGCGKFVVNIVSDYKYLSSKIYKQIFKQNQGCDCRAKKRATRFFLAKGQIHFH